MVRNVDAAHGIAARVRLGQHQPALEIKDGKYADDPCQQHRAAGQPKWKNCGLTPSQELASIRTNKEHYHARRWISRLYRIAGDRHSGDQEFYGSVFGWSFVDYGPDYVAFDSAGRQGGFNAERKVVAGGGPLVVLYAADLDGMEAKVSAAGAEITSRESFEGGRRFHFRDPNGNEIAVWTKAG